ncbi:MAG: hypothetical protein IJW58_03315 [Clostridia bacterium]|nr:hypothetical protein [Clostridia bacterium]
MARREKKKIADGKESLLTLPFASLFFCGLFTQNTLFSYALTTPSE